MKNIKKSVALILALTLLAPAATLYACETEDTGEATLPPALEAPLPDGDDTQTENGSGEGDNDGTDEPADGSTNGSTGDSANDPTDKPTGGEQNGGTVENVPVVKPTAQYTKYIRCTGDSVNLRSGAGTEFAVLGQAEKGETYAVVGQTGNWYKTYYRGKTAYFYASYAAVFSIKQSANEQVENVLNEGYKLLGVPYVYGAVRLHDGNGKLLGGFSAQRFDCSSLVQYVFYKGADKLLQVNTRTQVKQGKYVKPSELARGDCIFFTNEERKYNTGIERVGHVAIYLGDNYILHTASDHARIEKISAARWNFYIEARRFL